MIKIHENTYGACGPAHRVSNQTECQGLNMWKFLAETPLFLIYLTLQLSICCTFQ